MKGLFPFLGGLILLGAFVIAAYQYAQPDYGTTTICRASAACSSSASARCSAGWC